MEIPAFVLLSAQGSVDTFMQQ